LHVRVLLLLKMLNSINNLLLFYGWIKVKLYLSNRLLRFFHFLWRVQIKLNLLNRLFFLLFRWKQVKSHLFCLWRVHVEFNLLNLLYSWLFFFFLLFIIEHIEWDSFNLLWRLFWRICIELYLFCATCHCWRWQCWTLFTHCFLSHI
jgi:hypothetical protein